MTSSATDVILVERHGPVALVTLNRPEKRNAINAELAQAIVSTMSECQDARAVVITGAGSAFSAGLDLRNLGVEQLSELAAFLQAVSDSAVPTIAAVNGPAVTGGFELALACDFMVASPAAAFADTHLRVGVYPGPVLVDLPRRVGMAKAREMSLTGDFVDAETALRIGLVNHLVPPDELIPLAVRLAAAIAEQDPTIVTTMRRDWDDTYNLPRGDALRAHYRTAAESGFNKAGRSTLQANMAAVVDRAHGRPPS